jgi:hypothetical protein
MWRQLCSELGRFPAIGGALLATVLGVLPAQSQTEFTAGVVLDKMSPGERYTFIAGIVEGLAHARYEADGRETAGRSCIYRWFYDDKSAIDHIEQAFGLYRDRLPGSVVGALIQMRCGA